MNICQWSAEEEGVYSTACDNAFFFDTGDIGENGFKFCPYCGRPIATASITAVQADAGHGCVCAHSGGGKCNLPVGGFCTSSATRTS